MSFRQYLEKLTQKQDLSKQEALEVANLIMEGKLNDIIISALLTSLKTKGESAEEIAGFVSSMRDHAVKIYLGDALDTAGTGGDGMHTINVSTISAILVSQVYPVIKHGNRAASSSSGSADFLETLGYNITMSPEKSAEVFRKTKFTFLFAQLYHPAMRNVANVRKTLGIRTIFNLLGPLTNPAMTRRQVMGIFSMNFMDKIAEASVMLGYEKLLLVYGHPGIDEVSPVGPTTIYEISENKIEKYSVDFSELINGKVKMENLIVKNSEESVIKSLRALLGKDNEVLEFIKINTAVAIYAAGKAKSYDDAYEISTQLAMTGLGKIQEIIQEGGNIDRFKSLLGMVT
ncbi:anthranilate phosphoribosyltransferase [Acidianus sp. RZ1]|uniref:anthranilate phosphoribosyltransferase n=1 Tax=Acidianus sp. RZ1 TaxID=1540082 RepID=UPI0014910A35|nr:anthranilate phosphoribosyltransferase [Acidianus sp. RZ1]NON61481.1 anthranilate phosphoribosyltransferase [Acidianus sp. RZ1]